MDHQVRDPGSYFALIDGCLSFSGSFVFFELKNQEYCSIFDMLMSNYFM